MLRKALWRATVTALTLFAALFSGKFAYDYSPGGRANIDLALHEIGSADFELARRNYASIKFKGSASTAGDIRQPTLGDGQKYEKVATIGQSTRNFDADRKAIKLSIESAGALVQFEEQQGLGHRRILRLGVGVPPDKFDAFVEEIGKIGTLTQLSIVKNDKTNEYRQLRAKRESLEKALKALVDLNASGGSIDERLKVEARMSDLESQLQTLGVSLGEFDTQNEFCTVKVTLREAGAAAKMSLRHLLFDAFVWSAGYFIMLTGGFLALWVAFWLAAIVISMLVRLSQRLAREEQ
jgi:uncharacterized protein YfcZ (UPF0381/DUF406 family)